MIRALTRWSTRHHRRLLGVIAAMTVVFAIVGSGVTERLTVGGFSDPGAESTIVDRTLEDEFGTGSYGFVLVLQPKEKWIYSDVNMPEGERLVAAIAAESGVIEVASFYNVTDPVGGISPFRDGQGNHALIGVKLGGSDNEQREIAKRLYELYVEPTNDRFDIKATGAIEISRQAALEAEEDLVTAELISAPLLLLGLLFVFRGLRASLLPLVVAVFAVLASFAVLTLLVLALDISVFARTLVTVLGLGLAVDYSLLMVARFREERGAGRRVEVAVSRTLQTAGRTVLFSAGTVGSSLIGLLVFPVVYLRSFAFAGVAIVATAAAAALLLVPPLLMTFGEKLGSSVPSNDSFWSRQARRVMRHPFIWAIAVTALLVFLASPFTGLEVGRTDERVLPADNGARIAAETIQDALSWPDVNPIQMLAPDIDPTDIDRVFEFSSYLLDTYPDLARVDSIRGYQRPTSFTAPNELTPHFLPLDADRTDGTWFRLVSFRQPTDERVDELVEDLRAADNGFSELLVGGNNATRIDAVGVVAERLPYALAIIASVTMVLLFLMTGSVVVPIKAMVLNLLSLTATLGAMVWIFQDGNLSETLGFTPSGDLDVFTPILMFCIAFGLSMDYEVFLLARINEEYDLSDDNEHAVEVGIGRTGGVVTAAAILLAIVFLAIATSGVAIVKMIGLGLAIAVVTDAFLVRATLTPALMKLAGRLNWWAPGPLRRFHLRWGLWENAPMIVPGMVGTDERMSSSQLGRRLSQVPIFEDLSTSDLSTLGRHLDVVQVAADTSVVTQGGNDHAFFIVLEGRLRVVRDGESVATLASPDHFGEMAMLSGARRNATVESDTECWLAVLSERMFRVMVREMPSFAAAMELSIDLRTSPKQATVDVRNGAVQSTR